MSSSAGWRTAERTGALSHMPYAEVQRYSLLYDLQDLYDRTAAHDARASWPRRRRFLSGDFNPDKPNPRDSRRFGSA